jgi:hypothetical protein
LQDFLTFIVTQSLDSDQNLKEYRIGVDALKRGGAFDPAENSIVRVQAHRLRAKLADYYQHEGQAEDVRIDLEPGSYTPVIREGAIVTSMRSLRYPGLVFDFLPFEPVVVSSRESESAAYLYSVVSSHIDSLLRHGLRHRHFARNARTHVQLDCRVRAGAAGLRALIYLADADSRRVLLSQALSKSPGDSVSNLEKAGVEIAQAIWQRIDSVLACNG